MDLDRVRLPYLDIHHAKQLYVQSVSAQGTKSASASASCSPLSFLPLINQGLRKPPDGYYVELRKVKKHEELARLQALQNRRDKLRKLIECDRQLYQCELLTQGLTLYTDTLW